MDTAASGLPEQVCIQRALSPGLKLLQRPCRATEQQLQAYHTPEYVAYLRQARTDHNPKNWDDQTTSQAHPDHKRFNFGEDCPAFDGLFSFCQLYAGGHIHCCGVVELTWFKLQPAPRRWVGSGPRVLASLWAQVSKISGGCR